MESPPSKVTAQQEQLSLLNEIQISMPGFVWAGSGALLSYKGCYCNTLRKVLWCTSTHATQCQAHSRYCQAGSMDKWVHWIVRRFLCLRRFYWAPVQDFASKGVCSTRCVCVRRSYPPAGTLCEHVGEKECESCKREIYKKQMGFSIFNHLLWQCSGGGTTGLLVYWSVHWFGLD